MSRFEYGVPNKAPKEWCKCGYKKCSAMEEKRNQWLMYCPKCNKIYTRLKEEHQRRYFK